VKKPANKTWILVANRAYAKIFEHDAEETDRVIFLRELEHPEGRAMNREINTDKAGRQFSSVGRFGSPLDTENSPKEHEAERFAKEVAAAMDLGAEENGYSELVIIAEPKFLGRLRTLIGREASTRLVSSTAKDLAQRDAKELERELDGWWRDGSLKKAV
jgi:protein required for attachment to host cells